MFSFVIFLNLVSALTILTNKDRLNINVQLNDKQTEKVVAESESSEVKSLNIPIKKDKFNINP